MIDCFMHEFAFLSNYARILPESPVTVEHLYQAAKAACPEDAARIMSAETPGDAKKMARKIKKVDNWNEIKRHIMFNLLLYKFSFEKNKQKLLATGDEELCEGIIKAFESAYADTKAAFTTRKAEALNMYNLETAQRQALAEQHTKLRQNQIEPLRKIIENFAINVMTAE